MIRYSSPPRSAIIPALTECPGSAPERLEGRKSPELVAMQQLKAELERTSSEFSIDDEILHPDYYMKLPSGYKTCIGDEEVEPTLYQPTPKGLQFLITDFVEKTGLDFRLHDQEKTGKYSIRDRFNEAKKIIDALDLKEHQPVGMILSYGQMHAIPLLFVRHENKNHMVIFDSNSGGITKNYYAVANSFPDHQVMLNKGTRQADSQSCITDAFEIIGRALQLSDVHHHIFLKAEKPEVIGNKNQATSSRPKFFSTSVELKHNNFWVFGMPEELCFTAQRKEFIEQSALADLTKPIEIRGRNTTLEMELIRHKRVSHRPLNSSPENPYVRRKFFGMNSYLYEASREHKRIIDDRLAREFI